MSPASIEMFQETWCTLCIFAPVLVLQITKVCLQGMISKNEKHSATFMIVLLVLSKRS